MIKYLDDFYKELYSYHLKTSHIYYGTIQPYDIFCTNTLSYSNYTIILDTLEKYDIIIKVFKEINYNWCYNNQDIVDFIRYNNVFKCQNEILSYERKIKLQKLSKYKI